MGWLFSRQWETREQLLEHLRRTERFSPRCELIKSSPRGNNHWYVAKNRETGVMWIGLDLMKGGTRASPGWGYKDLDETCGPVEMNCPISLLRLVEGQPTNDWGTEWRQRVKASHERNAARRAALVPDAMVVYGGRLYRLEARWHVGTGWRVSHMQELGGRLVPTQSYRMSLNQLLKAEPYTPARTEPLFGDSPCQIGLASHAPTT